MNSIDPEVRDAWTAGVRVGRAVLRRMAVAHAVRRLAALPGPAEGRSAGGAARAVPSDPGRAVGTLRRTRAVVGARRSRVVPPRLPRRAWLAGLARPCAGGRDHDPVRAAGAEGGDPPGGARETAGAPPGGGPTAPPLPRRVPHLPRPL